MLDLETLDTGSNAAILSIGACEFDGGNREFYQAVQIYSQGLWGRTESAQTRKWWSEQSEEARRVFADPNAVSLPVALMKFGKWVGKNEVEMWGNGSDFDCVILGNAYDAVEIAKPWSYSKNRCFRTLRNLGIKLEPGEGYERVGTQHNALDDAKYQAHYAAAYLRVLGVMK